MATNPTNLSTPQEDADRIRLKRLAKLQGSAAASSSNSATATRTPSPAISSLAPSTSSTPPIKPSPSPKPSAPSVQPSFLKRVAEVPSVSVPLKKKTPALPVQLDLPTWENEVIGQIFNVTLSKDIAEKSGWEVVWLKELAQEMETEAPNGPKPPLLSGEVADRLLIARLEIDPQAMSDDLEFLPVVASLPAGQTVFEYLVGCWKRINAARSALSKKGYPPQAMNVLDKVRELVISYAGLTLQEPEMFPQPQGRTLGPSELVAPLLSMSSLSTNLLANSTTPTGVLAPTDIEQFLRELAVRFEPENEIDGVLGPVVRSLCFHPSLFRPEGLAGGDASWRGIIGGLEALVNIPIIARMIPRLEDWNPPNATANDFEFKSLFGPLLRLGVFEREWPSIAVTYFMHTEGKPATDMESATASLRGTLKSLQSALFQVFNGLVRASSEARESVLQYFARIVLLNNRRAGMQVDAATVASDAFVVNAQTILLRFCEPFMDANYTKIDRIDPLYLAHSNRLNLDEETRINATSQEAEQWKTQNQSSNAPAPNFISDIFYLTLTLNHYGYQKTISSFEELSRQYDDMERHLEMLEGDGSWRGSIFQARTEAAIRAVKVEMDKVRASQLAYQVQLGDPELIFRSLAFANFVSIWLIRFVDPKHKHPNPVIDLPLPLEVPLSFKVLPEFAIEDVVDYHFYVMRNSPSSMELSGKVEVLLFALTFLSSTWYIKNPFLKSKMVEVLCWGSVSYDGRSRSVLVSTLNTHPVALKHLMPSLMNLYIEVEHTGASSQFYDKFNARRNIAVVFRTIWNNQAHRDALKNEARDNIERFVRFVNLMINDVTYLMDESLSILSKIHDIQSEMADQDTYSRQPTAHRRERESTLRTLERQAISYTQLGASTVALLKTFTAETKQPFMVPEIVDRLAAMLDYNLDALVGPKCQDLRVSNPEKYKFNPKQLLSDILEVYLNLSDQGEFARAVAGDGRSYKKELFERAAGIARKRMLKSEDEIEKLRLFVVKVEETKATIEAEEDLGEIPDEFLDPLMYTLMRDPVTLPNSKAVVDRSTIKSHLLSDATDPFNRMPLKLEDVEPNTELKGRIDAFLAERRNKNTALDKPEQDIVHMDTTSD
ncbi:ubiquitin elongating factor core-domain-containing protein [Abortiporus biennis]|nr:ubiquitin elongating factor core-domain-containing protein [Abortiporus biennis]